MTRPAGSAIPVYLINLDGSDARLASATAQLAQAGVAFERVPAVDGRDSAGGLAQFAGQYAGPEAIAYMGRALRGGELGCFLSHVRCAGRLLASSAPWAIVLEDDLQLDPARPLLASVQAAVRWLDGEGPGPGAWDVIHIGPPGLKIATLRASLGATTLHHAHYFPITTTGLVWSRAGAQAFVAASERIFCPVDNFLRHWQLQRHRGYALMPALLAPTGAASDIDGAAPARARLQRAGPMASWIKQRRMWRERLTAHVLRWRG